MSFLPNTISCSRLRMQSRSESRRPGPARKSYRRQTIIARTCGFSNKIMRQDSFLEAGLIQSELVLLTSARTRRKAAPDRGRREPQVPACFLAHFPWFTATGADRRRRTRGSSIVRARRFTPATRAAFPGRRPRPFRNSQSSDTTVPRPSAWREAGWNLSHRVRRKGVVQCRFDRAGQAPVGDLVEMESVGAIGLWERPVVVRAENA